MIDFGLSKLALIGVIALVVIGPERLPRVARTIGTLLGRAQRYVADVKAEVSREMDLDELRKMGNTVRDAAQNFESSVRDGIHKTEVSVQDVLADAERTAAEPIGVSAPLEPTPWLATEGVKRKNWRKRQRATPQWFKQASRVRTHVQSGAARVARHRYKSPH